jgi:hypothetical protein
VDKELLQTKGTTKSGRRLSSNSVTCVRYLHGRMTHHSYLRRTDGARVALGSQLRNDDAQCLDQRAETGVVSGAQNLGSSDADGARDVRDPA